MINSKFYTMINNFTILIIISEFLTMEVVNSKKFAIFKIWN